MAEGNAAAFTKTICSICYEDLKPIIEDLQSISVCGHVFHELCLQQWFEYCNKGKKSCPVCKQTCSKANVGRLYFQSTGDPNDKSSSQKPRDNCQNPEELYNEVKRLEGKVSGLTSALEQHQKNFNSASEELFACKEQCKVEKALKNEALNQKAAIQKLLHLKSQDLDQSTLERIRLQERNMALAKELAALKLISDLNLGEDEMLKLASLGNEANSKATIDVLRKSLMSRNKSYKELMAKCNALGRGEARSLSKLEKANEKIKKLKVRIQELESMIEVNDNIALRNLKASKQATYDVNNLNTFDQATKTPQTKSFALQTDVNQGIAVCDILSNSTKKRRLNDFEDTNKQRVYTGATDDKRNQDSHGNVTFSVNENKKTSEVCSTEFSYKYLKPANENGAVRKCHSKIDDKIAGPESIDLCNDATPATMMSSKVKVMPDSKHDKVKSLQECIILDPPELSVRKEDSAANITYHPGVGDSCFSGGLLGPGGTNWHLGKWCKKAQRNTEPLMQQGSIARNSDLIAVGGDGRGGKIKFLRSLDQPSTESKENLGLAKKCKSVTKNTSTSQQSHGCLQIEHFFGRGKANHS